MNEELKQTIIDFLDYFSKLDYDNNKDLYDEALSILPLNEIFELEDALDRFIDPNTILKTSFENRISLIIKGKVTKIKAFNKKANKKFPKTDSQFGFITGEDIDIQL